MAIISFIALATINGFASEYFWYWLYEETDIITHGLGGMSVGFLSIFFINKYFPHTQKNFTHTFISTIILTLIIGIAWEFFEYFFKIQAVWSKEHIDDTTLDLIMDTIGAIVALIISHPYLQNIYKLRKTTHA